MRRSVLVIGSLCVLAGLTGCVETALTAGASAGIALSEERGLGGALSDTRIRTDINSKWLQSSMDILQKVNLSVQEGRVHLSGTLPTPEMRLEAVKLVWQVDGVRQVFNDIEVGEDKSGFGDYVNDVTISTRLRFEILTDRAIQSVNYSIETVGGIVYLMGVAQNQAELDRVTNYARNLRYVKRVVSYVRIKSATTPVSAPAGGPPPAGGAPARAAPLPDSTPAPPPAAAPGRAPVEAEPLAPPGGAGNRT